MPSGYKSIRELSDEKAVERVTNDLSDAQAAKEESIERCKRYRNIYMALDPPDDRIDEDSGQIEDDEDIYSNTYLAIGAAMADASVTQLFSHFFATEDYMEIAAQNWEDELFAMKVTAHMKKRHKDMMFRHKIYRVLQQANCFDYGVTLSRWYTRAGYVPKRQVTKTTKMLGGVAMPYQESKVVPTFVPDAIDRSDIVVLDYFNCWHDPAAKDGFEDSRFFIDERLETFDNLKMYEQAEDRPWGRYKNIDEVIKRQLEADAQTERITNDPVDRGKNMDMRRVRISRYWTMDHVVEQAQGLVIARYDIWGWPLQCWKVFERPSEFAGMGLLQRIERNQMDVNASLNSIRDFQNLIQNPIMAASSDLASKEGGQINLYPGKTIVTSGDPERKIKFYQPGVDTTSTALEAVSLQYEMMRVVARISENQNAAYAKGRRSATEAREVASGADNATFQLATRLEETCLEPFYLRQFMLEQVMMTKDEQFKHLGPEGMDWLTIRPEDYYWNALPNFSARGSHYMRFNEFKNQQFMTFVQMAMTMFPGAYNTEALALKLAQIMDPKDFQRFIRDPRSKTHDVPPNIENFMIAHGQPVEISDQNDHGLHIRIHEGVKKTPDYQIWPEASVFALDQHIDEHKAMASQSAGMVPQMGAGMQDESDMLRGMHGPEPRTGVPDVGAGLEAAV